MTNLTRRTFLRGGTTVLLGASLAVLGACAPAPTGAREQVPTQAAAPQTTSTQAATPQAATRSFTHAMGESQIPTQPQRVITLDSGELDTAIALGVKPVGAVSFFQDGGFLSYLRGKTDGITNVGTLDQPNLEQMTVLKPDLILSSKLRHAEIYPRLAAIAPTVFAENIGVTWKENLLLYGDALGKKAEAEKKMADYYARLADFKTQMGDRLAKTQVSVVRVVGNGIRIIQKQMYMGVILQDAGLPRPPSQDKDARFETVSLEKIPEMDGDVIFVSFYGQTEEKFKELLAHPLWARNRAVQAGRVYQVNDDIWQSGIGITAANLVIDDLYTYLIKEWK